jgi:hypothetical protein
MLSYQRAGKENGGFFYSLNARDNPPASSKRSAAVGRSG